MSAGQRGAALLMVTALLAMLSLLALSVSQNVVGLARLQRNVSDRQRAAQSAGLALPQAEAWVAALDKKLNMADRAQKPADLYGPAGIFPPHCQGPAGKGVCEPTVPPHKRMQDGVLVLHPCGTSQELALETGQTQPWCPAKVRHGVNHWANPRFMVELVDPRFPVEGQPGTARLYRITVRAWGLSERSAATMQSWYRVVRLEDMSVQGKRLNHMEVLE
ncbi:pilus assembly protein [Chromobacterium sp. IIBBL 290-4]|uniref:pilus assembly PilX family protein n=1 Tax=Chromobacterium sp. IIBBL 290-4 TaxID=2953890 RepID=UPI0020B6551B|nr:pilus assembly protein [Chromobacterium sp. IIBBL 290-4]UTH75314.1 pilus assembly protein [Chromobacterium sp. IIBBL 290-4]